MWIGSERECAYAVSEAKRIGLFVDEGIASPLSSESSADRHWWLKEGAPVKWHLASFARGSGEPAGVQEIPAERVGDLRRLFPAKRYDPDFRDRYPVDDALRAQVGKVLQVVLDPELDYVVSSYSPDAPLPG